MKAQIGRLSYDDQRARGTGHDPVIVSRTLAPGLGALSAGLLLAHSPEGAVPYEEVAAEALGIGHGNGKQFLRRLNSFGITVEEFERIYEEVFRG